MGSKTNFTPAQVKEILDAHENTLMKFFNAAVEKLERKIDTLSCENAVLKKEMVDLKTSMQFHSDRIDEKLAEVDNKVKEVYVVNEGSVKDLIDTQTKMQLKVTDLEDRSRRNNLRFDGLAETRDEDWHSCEVKIKDLIREQLGIKNEVVIEHAHRVGGKADKDDPSYRRTIVAKFLNFKDKEKVLNRYRSCKLWEDRIYINEDFSEETLAKRKELLKKAKELRKNGKFAKVIHNRLITHDNQQPLDETEGKHEEENSA